MTINYKTLLNLTLLSSLFLACSPNTNSATERFKLSTIEEDSIIEDTKTHLLWVNGSNTKAIDGCKGFPKNVKNTKSFIKKEILNHCEKLIFAGHNNWRVPTVKEHQSFILGMKGEKKTPYYTILACPRVIGTEGNNIATTNTHNTKPIGEINPWKDGNNGGIRCVKDLQ